MTKRVVMMRPTTKSLQKEVDDIKLFLNGVNTRLENIEQRLAVDGVPEAIPELEEDAQPDIKTSKKEEKTVKHVAIEAKIGTQWFPRIGLFSLILGIGFFLKYAFDNDWVGLLGRVIIGIITGLFLVAVGEFFETKKHYQRLTRLLTGGGFSILYFSFYAAYHFKNYRQAIGISWVADTIFLSVVVFIALVFSLKYNSKSILGIALFMGYVTSLLSDPIGTFTLVYCLIITLGAVLVSSYKKWASIGIGGLIATYFVFSIWYFHSRSFIGLYFLVSYFILFTLSSYLYQRKGSKIHLGLVVAILNSVFFYAFFMNWLHKFFPGWQGLFTIGFGSLYLLLASFAKDRKLPSLSTTYLVSCIVYLTLAVPVQWNNELVTIAWAIEGFVLLYLAFKIKSVPIRYLGYLVTGIAFFKTLVIDWHLQGLSLTNPLQSTRIFVYIATILSFYLSGYLLDKYNELLSADERKLERLYYYAFILLIVMITALELDNYWISVGWGLEAVVLIYLGFIEKLKEKRVVGIILFTLTIGKVFLIDFSQFATGYRIISFIGLGTILITASFLYAKYREVLH